MAEDTRKVRHEEQLKIKIAEAKNLLARSHGVPSHRDTYCILSLDQEEIFRTPTVEKTLNPFFGDEFQFDVPRHFRYISIYVCEKDRHLKQDKILGKVAILREDLKSYNNKDHWFTLCAVDADSEVQGKAHIEIRFDGPRTRVVNEYNLENVPSLTEHSTKYSKIDIEKVTLPAKAKVKSLRPDYNKFGSYSSTTNKRLLSAAITADNLSGLSRSESLNTNGILSQSNTISGHYHHTFGPSSSRNIISDSSTAISQFSDYEDDRSIEAMRNIMTEDMDSQPQYFVQPDLKNQLYISVLECSELTTKNGQCDPYAMVDVIYSNDRRVTRKTKVKKKTVNPQFYECLTFNLFLNGDPTKEQRDSSNNAYDINIDSEFEVVEAREVCVTLYHEPAIGGSPLFLGEVRAPLMQKKIKENTRAWYFLRSRAGPQCPKGATPPGSRLSTSAGAKLGSLRLVLRHTLDKVLTLSAYDDLSSLLLRPSPNTPVSSSAVYILGEIVLSKTDLAQPLVQLFTHEDQLVRIIRSLAVHELSTVTDPTTIFRGNTLVSKMMDEAMRLVGLTYLQLTLKPTLDLIFSEKKPCEIDPTRVKDQSTVESNLVNLISYVNKIFEAITKSFISCPAVMCRLFDALRQCAVQRFPRNAEVRYSVISGFIILRFFAPAILGPRLFDLTTEQLDPQTNRTLTLISKTIQSLGNLVSSQVCKEEYMAALFKGFSSEKHVQDIKLFLEIISSSTTTQNNNLQETPVLLKEGTMAKKTQRGKRLLRANFKQRYFRLTNCELSYSKTKVKKPCCTIALADITSAEKVPELNNLKLKNMLKIVYSNRVLCVQAANCVEQTEWLNLLLKLCEGHTPPTQKCHNGVYSHSSWTCCSASKLDAVGCSEVPANAARSPQASIRHRLDPARHLQRLHCLILSHISDIDKLKLKNTAEHPESYQKTLKDLVDVAYRLEDMHRTHQRSLRRQTEYGSKQAPIDDDNYLHLMGRSNSTPEWQPMEQKSSMKYISNPASFVSQTSTSRTMPPPRPSPTLPPKYNNFKQNVQSPTGVIHITKKNSFQDSTSSGNHAYMDSMAAKLSNRSADERSSNGSNKSAGAGSGYLRMNSLKNESSINESDSASSTSSNIAARSSPVRESTRPDRLPLTVPPKTSCEYVEVRPKIEREMKPKTGIYNKEKMVSLEESADNPQYYCREYELMSNFSTDTKRENDTASDVPPAVPPRSHIGKFLSKVTADMHSESLMKLDGGTDSGLRERKSFEHYQLKTVKCDGSTVDEEVLRIIEPGDILIQDKVRLKEDAASAESTQEERSQSKCDLKSDVGSLSDIRDCEEGGSGCARRTQGDIECPIEANADIVGKVNFDNEPDVSKKKGKSEDYRFFSRISLQRKSKLSDKKTTSVDGGIGWSENPAQPIAKSQPALSDRLTPSFLKKKTKVGTDSVRLQGIC